MTDYHWELLRLERLAMIAGMLPSTPRYPRPGSKRVTLWAKISMREMVAGG